MESADADETGRRLFNAGRFREAHEAWEAGFRSSVGERRDYFRALAQVGAAFVHAEAGNTFGALRVVGRALEVFSRAEDPRCGEFLELLVPVQRSWKKGQPWTAPQLPPPSDSHEGPGGVPLEVSHPTGCPYCGEAVRLEVSGIGADTEEYVEDCPVCCRPWTVRIRRDGERVEVLLLHQDA